MGKALSIDLRKRVVEFVEAGHSRREAARHFRVSPSFVIRLMARVQKAGTIVPVRQGRPRGGGKLAPYADFITGQVDEKPDITMPKLVEALYEAHGIRAAPATLSRFLIRTGYTYKKNAHRHGARAGAG